MTGLLTAPASQALMYLSPKKLEKKLTEIKKQKDFRDISTNELISDLLSFSLSSDVLCELLDLFPGVQELALIAVHPSFDLRAAVHLGRAWSASNRYPWGNEDASRLEVFSRHKSVFLAYAAASLSSFWYFSDRMESTNLEGLGRLEREKLKAKENEKAFMNLLQSLEEGGFPLLDVALTLLRDARSSNLLNQNEEIISLCELAKGI